MSRQIGDRSVFDRTHGPAVGASGDGLEGAYSAILNSVPSADAVKVIVPNLWGLTTARTAACSPAFTGSPGDRVLVVFDEEKQPWVVESLADPAATGFLPSRAERNGALALPVGVFTAVQMDTILTGQDLGGHFNLTNGQYVVPVTGWYHVDAQIDAMCTGAAFDILLSLWRNTTEIVRGARIVSTGTQIMSPVLSCKVQATTGDLLGLKFFCSGNACNLETTAVHIHNYMDVTRVA
jgi:hypothetical protein